MPHIMEILQKLLQEEMLHSGTKAVLRELGYNKEGALLSVLGEERENWQGVRATFALGHSTQIQRFSEIQGRSGSSYGASPGLPGSCNEYSDVLWVHWSQQLFDQFYTHRASPAGQRTACGRQDLCWELPKSYTTLRWLSQTEHGKAYFP